MELASIMVRFLADFSSVQEAVSEVTDEVSSVAESAGSVADLSQSFQEAQLQAEGLAEAVQGVSEATAPISETASSLSELGSAADAAATGISGIAESAGSVSAVDDSLSGLNDGLDQIASTASQVAGDVADSMDQISTSASQAGDTVGQSGETGGTNFMQGMSQVGMSMMAVQGGINMVQNAFQQATGPFGNFQEQMTQLQTGAGEVAGPNGIGLVTKGILNMAIATGTSTDQLSAGMYMIESAGFHGAQGLKVLQAAAEGSKVGAADLATVANAVTSALNAYGMKATQAASFTNQLIATVAAGKMHMQDLANSLSAVLPVAAAAHISYAQIGGAIATMTAQGTSAQQATQDLANTIRSLQSPNSVAINEMQQMGLSSNQVAMQLGKKGLTGTLSELTDAILAHMGPAGTVLQSAFQNSTNAAKDAQDMISTMPASLQKLADSYLKGSVTAKTWRTDLQGLDPVNAKLMTQFASVADKTHSFNSLLAAGGPAAQTYTAAMSKMLGGSTGLNVALQLTGTHMATFQKNVESISNAAKKGGDSITGWNLVQKDFNQQMAVASEKAQVFMITLGSQLAPIILKVMGDIGQAANFVSKYRVEFLAAAGVLTAFFIPALIKSGVEAIKAGAQMAIGVGQNVVKYAMQGYEAAGELASGIAKIASQAAEMAVSFVTETIPAVISFIGESITAAVTAIPGMVAGFISWAGAAWGAAAATIAATWPILLVVAGILVLIGIIILLVTHWSAVTSFIRSAWTAVMTWLEGALHAVGAFFTSIWNGILAFLKTAWNTIVSVAKAAALALLVVLTGPLGLIVVYVMTHFQQVKAIVLTAWNDIKALFTAALRWLSSLVSGFVTDEVRYWTTLWSRLKAIVTALWNDIEGANRAALDWLSNLVSTFVSNEVRSWTTLWTEVKQIVTRLWDDVTGLFSSAWNGLAGALAHLQDNIASWFLHLGSLALTWGKDFIQNLINGILSMAGGVGNAVSSIASKITSFLHFSHPDQGPLADVETWMPDFGTLLATGIAAQVGKIQSAIGVMVQPIAALGGAATSPVAPASVLASSAAPGRGTNATAGNGQQVTVENHFYLDGTAMSDQIMNHVVSRLRASGPVGALS